MSAVALPAELRAAAPGIAHRLAAILLALAALVAHAFLKDPRRVALIVPLWTRLNRATRRFARAMDRLAAGTALRPSRPGRSGGGSPPPSLPSTRAWLLVALRHHGAGHANRLDRLLAEPEAAALVAASPQATRILRPICRILGISPACVPPLPRRRPAPLSVLPPLARAVPAMPAEAPRDWVATPPTMPPPPCVCVRWPWFNPFGPGT